METAIRLTGSAAALARALGKIKPNTPNEWLGRVRQGGRLSYDKRERLQDFIDTIEARAAAPVTPGSADDEAVIAFDRVREAGPLDHIRERAAAVSVGVRNVLSLTAGVALSPPILELPPGYRERYRERLQQLHGESEAEIERILGDLVALRRRIERQLGDFVERLRAEAAANRRRRSDG